MQAERHISVDTVLTMHTLVQDRLTAELSAEFAAAGVPSIVLKGPALATWLYRGIGVRPYGDTDLLVPPFAWDTAIETLMRLGYRDGLAALAHPRMESITSHPWAKRGHEVDLHCTLWGLQVAPERVWEILSSMTVPLAIGGSELPVLAPAPRAMHVALHAAQHGYDEGRPIVDLELALEQLPLELWEEAGLVARDLDALGGFATGLRLVPAGRAVAAQLGIADQASVDALLRVEHVPLAQGFEELANTPGMRGKLRVLRGELLPNADFMRWWSPLARRGRIGLALAYLWRPLYLTLRTGPGLAAWRRARRRAQG